MTSEASDHRTSADQSPPATPPAPDPRAETRILLVIIWITAVFSLTMSFGFNSLSPDDAMRLVQVRDLLAGQSWFDLTQYRLAPPHGVVTHWSRLVDLPLALLISLFKLVMPQAMAEKATLVVWPILLLLGYLAGVTQIARTLAGETAARIALLFAVLMAPVLQHFRIDSIHHHNVQIVLITWTLARLLRGSPRGAALAGLTSALSIAVGAEMAPVIAVLAVVVAAHWIVTGDARLRATMAYGIALGSSVPLFMIATVPPAAYMTVHCDSLSIAQTGALAIGGFGLAAIAALRLSLTMRITAAAGLALLLGMGIMAIAPRCVADPYAHLDPRLAALWLASVSEARSAVAMLRDLPHQIPAYVGVPLAALLLGSVCCLRTDGRERWNWIAAAGAQLTFVVIALWQVRGTAGANAIAAALFPAALIVCFPTVAETRSRFGLSRGALVALLLINPAALLAIGGGAARAIGFDTPQFVTSGDTGTCQQPADYTPLATLPPGRVLAFIDAGPFILMQSGSTVFGAPYHRNETGNLATLDVFLAAPGEVARQMAARDIAYVAFCPGSPERHQYTDVAPGGLAAALAKGEVPDFLEQLPAPGSDLLLYRVRL
ncbi:MAG: hypothetical protein ACTHLY_01485 [Pseudolabrys sp.]